MPKGTRLTALIAAGVLAVGVSACASSREVVVGTDPGGSGTTGDAQSTGAAVSTASLESELYRLVTARRPISKPTTTTRRTWRASTSRRAPGFESI